VPQDSAEVGESARRAAIALARELAIIEALGGFVDPVSAELLTVFDAADLIPEGDQAALIAALREADAEAAAELTILAQQGVIIDPLRQQAIAALTDADYAALEQGSLVAPTAELYELLLEDLVLRNGRPNLEQAAAYDPVALAASLEALLGVEAGADEAVEEPAVGAATEPLQAETSSDDDSSLPLILGVLAVMLVAVGAAIAFVLLRKKGPAVSDFDELLDVSRRLAAAVDPRDVERIAVGEAVRLSRASAGALVHRSADAYVVGFQSQDGMLVPNRLGDGVLARVAETAGAVTQVSSTEPALRNLPVSLAAVPVVASGRVAATLMVVRSDDSPFLPTEVEMLRSLAPVVAAALESARYTDEAEERSLLDGLTGVGNRLRLERELPALVSATDSPTSLIMVDLDHFKAVNDSHGHQAGDDLLRAVADLIRVNVRPRDTVYRYGGEEFCVVLPGATKAEAVEVAERVRGAIEGAETASGPDNVIVEATASFGVASARGGDSETLVRRADEALYEAKETGRNRVVAG
jgi:diguanylate cyclase (GGDEF)-like protein